MPSEQPPSGGADEPVQVDVIADRRAQLDKTARQIDRDARDVEGARAEDDAALKRELGPKGFAGDYDKEKVGPLLDTAENIEFAERDIAERRTQLGRDLERLAKDEATMARFRVADRAVTGFAGVTAALYGGVILSTISLAELAKPGAIKAITWTGPGAYITAQHIASEASQGEGGSLPVIRGGKAAPLTWGGPQKPPFNPEAPSVAGAFGNWRTIGETPGGAVGQSNNVAWGAACGEMLSGIPQATLLESAGAPASPEALAAAMGPAGMAAMLALKTSGTSWDSVARGSPCSSKPERKWVTLSSPKAG